MPPKKITIPTLPVGQQSIQFLFQKPGATAATSATAATAATAVTATSAATTNTKSIVRPSETPAVDAEHPEIRAFYASLRPAEKIAHTIAMEALGTSYDVTRTHGFLKWKKSLA